MELRDEILSGMAEVLSAEQSEKLAQIIDIVSYKYEIRPKSTELRVYDDSNIRVIKRFVATKRLEGLSEKTIEQYYKSVSMMVDQLGKNIREITTDDVRYYLAVYQKQRNVSKATLDNYRRYLSAFFVWLTAEELIDKNPMLKIKKIRIQKKVRKAFSDTEMEQLRQSATTIRDRTLIEFLYSTGCRVSEVIGVDTSDIDISTQSVIVRGKGNKEREVYISDKAMYWLNQYLKSRKDNEKALFVGKRGRLHKEGLEAIIRRLGTKANVDAYPHKFRRTIATDLINRGMPVQEVQQMLGHTSLDTTMIYCVVDSKNVHNSHRKYAA